MEPKNIYDITADLSLTQNPQDPSKRAPGNQPPQEPRPDIVSEILSTAPPVGVDLTGYRLDAQMSAKAANRMQDILSSSMQQDPVKPPAPAQDPLTAQVAAAADRLKQSMSDDLMRSFQYAYQQQPDFAAEVQRISKRLNMDPALVARNPDMARQIYDRLDFSQRSLMQKNPAMAQSLSDPQIMAVAKDDLDNLSLWDGIANAYSATQLQMRKGLLANELASFAAQGDNRAVKAARDQIAALDKEIAKLPFPQEGAAGWLPAVAGFFGQQTELAPIAALYGTGGAAIGAGAAAAGVATAPAAPIAAVGGFMLGFRTGMGVEYGKVERGLTYLESIKEGMPEQTAQYVAVGSAMTSAALEFFGLGKLTGPAKRALIGEVTQGISKAFVKAGFEAAENVASETVVELSQDIGRIAAQELGRSASGMETMVSTEEGRKKIADQLIQTAVQTLQVMSVVGPLSATPTIGAAYLDEARRKEVQRANVEANAKLSTMKQVQLATEQDKLFRGMVENAKASKVPERSQDAYEQIARGQLNQIESTGVPIKNVYISVERFAEALDKLRMSVEELANLLPDQIQSIQEAMATGPSADVVIPTEKFLSTLATHPLGDAVMEDVRLSDNPMVMSAREAKARQESLAEDLKKAAAELDQRMAEDDALRAEVAEVQQKIEGQVLALPGFGMEEAKTVGVMYGQMAATLAKRANMSVREFAEKYPFTIVEAGKEGGAAQAQAKEQQAASDERAQKAFADSDKKIAKAKESNNDKDLLVAAFELRERGKNFGDKQREDEGQQLINELESRGYTFKDPKSTELTEGDQEITVVSTIDENAGAKSDEGQVGTFVVKVLSPIIYKNGNVVQTGQVVLGQTKESMARLSKKESEARLNSKTAGIQGGTKRIDAATTEQEIAVIREEAAQDSPELVEAVDSYIQAKKTIAEAEAQRAARKAKEPEAKPERLQQLGQGPIQFYSALERSVLALPIKAGTAASWGEQLQSLINKGLVKEAEVEATGLREFLAMAQGEISKEQVVEFLKNKGVRVETQGYGEMLPAELAAYNEKYKNELADIDAMQKRINALDNLSIGALLGGGPTKQQIAEADAAIFDFVGDDGKTTVFSNIAEDIAAYYKRAESSVRAGVALDAVNREEIAKGNVLELPGYPSAEINVDNVRKYVFAMSPSNRRTLLSYVLVDYARRVIAEKQRLIPDPQTQAGGFEDYVIAGDYANYREIVLKLPLAVGKKFRETAHFKDWNPIAHIRTTDRMDSEGKRILFIEEIQSDWGQTGQDEGFVGQRVQDMREKIFVNDDLKTVTQQIAEATDDAVKAKLEIKQAQLQKRLDKLTEAIAKRQYNIERGPFVETTTAWLTLALKKVLMMAAEGGYDRVLFTTGQQQADRYGFTGEDAQGHRSFYGDINGHVIGVDGKPVMDGSKPRVAILPKALSEVLRKFGGEKAGPIVSIPSVIEQKIDELTNEIKQINEDLEADLYGDRPLAINPFPYASFEEYAKATYVPEILDKLTDVDRKAYENEKTRWPIEQRSKKRRELELKRMDNRRQVSRLLDKNPVGRQLGFNVTDNLVRKIEGGLPLFAGTRGEPRGWIGRDPFNPNALIAAITQKGKGDTILHEMFHFYFYALEDQVLRGNANEELTKDFLTLLQYQGIPDLETWNKMTPKEREPFYENVAYGWETWLAKGEAPSVELDGVFRRIARWFRETYANIVTELKQLYRDNFGRELILPTQDVEQVFARMVASDDAVQRSMRLRNMQFPYTDASAADLAPGTLSALKELWDEMVEEAVIEVTGKAVSDIQWLSGADTPAMREMQKKHDALREETRDRVKEEVAAEPIYRAIRHFQKGELVNEEGEVTKAGKNHKLNSAEVQKLLPEGANAKKVSKYTKANGLPVDEAATWYGFPDGKTLVDALASALPFADEVKKRVDKEMLEKHGELVGPVATQRAVRKAIDNDKRTQFLAAVLRHSDIAFRKSVDALSPEAQATMKEAEARLVDLKKEREALKAQLKQAEEAKLLDVVETTQDQLRTNQNAISRERRKMTGPLTSVRDLMIVARRQAEAMLANKKLRDISSFRYSQQQARASKEASAALAKMDLENVVRHQQSELLLHALTKETAQLEEQVDDALDNWKKFFRDDEKMRKNRDMDWINLGRGILTLYGVGRSDKPARQYLAAIKEYDPELHETLEPMLAQAESLMAGRKNYLDLTVDEFLTAVNTLDRIWTESRRKLEIGQAEKREKLADVLGKLNERLGRLAKDKVRPGEKHAVTDVEEGWVNFLGDVALTGRVQHWCNSLDETLSMSGEPGEFTKYIWRPIDNATESYLGERKVYIGKLAKKFKANYNRQPTRYSKVLDYTWGKRTGDASAELFGHLLQLGTKDNKERHARGRADIGWATIDPETGAVDMTKMDAFLKEAMEKGWVTKEMMALVQESWNVIKEVNDKFLQPAHRDKTGDYMETIPAQPFTLTWPDGETITYPGGYAPSQVDRKMSALGSKIESFEDLRMDVRNQRPQPPNGMTKKRLAGVVEPRSMNPMIILEAIDNELRYGILGPAIDDVLKIVNDREFTKMLNLVDPKAKDKKILPWLNAVASQRTSKASGSPNADRILTTIRGNLSIDAMAWGVVNATQNVTGIFQAWSVIPGKYLVKALVAHTSNIRPGYNKLSAWVASQDANMEQRMSGQVIDAEQQMRRIFENPGMFTTIKDMARPVFWIIQTLTQNHMDTITWYARYMQTMEEMGADVTDMDAHNEAVQRARNAVTLTQHSPRPENVATFEVATPFMKLFTQFIGYVNLLANLNGSEFKKTIRSDMSMQAKYARLLYVYMLGWAIPLAVGEMIKRAYGDDLEPEEDQSWSNFVFWDLFVRPQWNAVAQAIPYYGQALRLASDAADDKPYNDKLQMAPAVRVIEKGVVALTQGFESLYEQGEVTGRALRDGMALFSALSGVPTRPISRALSYQAQVEAGKVEPTSDYDYFRGLATGLASPESKR